MAKTYDSALHNLISTIDDKTATNGEKMVAASKLILAIELHMEQNPSNILDECVTLSTIYDTLSKICKLSSVQLAAKAVIEGM